MIPYFKSSDRAFTLLHGDCIELLKQFSFKFDMIFADPPYFLSNGGISVQSGKMVCVDYDDVKSGKHSAIIRDISDLRTNRLNKRTVFYEDATEIYPRIK